MLIEGVHPLREARNTSAQLTAVLLSTDIEQGEEPAELARDLAERGTPVLRAEARTFALAAETDTPPGILAVAPFPELPIEIPAHEKPLFLVTDSIRDPGNLGTLIRSAQGAGAHAVLVGPGSVDPYSPKVVRAAMGSHFHQPIAPIDWSKLPDELLDCAIFAADSGAVTSYDRIDWQEPSAIIVGNESAGLSDGARALASGKVGIPLAKALESLNAAIAGSVILFEAARHRRKG